MPSKPCGQCRRKCASVEIDCDTYKKQFSPQERGILGGASKLPLAPAEPNEPEPPE